MEYTKIKRNVRSALQYHNITINVHLLEKSELLKYPKPHF